MKFAKIVFLIASLWGLLVLTPLYFMFERIGQQDPPPITHPAFFYGFVGAGLAWQIAFFLISRDPARFRPMIPAAVFEKFSFGIATIVLFLQHRLHAGDLVFTAADLFLGILFIAAFFKTAS